MAGLNPWQRLREDRVNSTQRMSSKGTKGRGLGKGKELPITDLI